LTSAIVLTRVVRTELEAFGTVGGERLDDHQVELAQRTLRAVLHHKESVCRSDQQIEFQHGNATTSD
jgi:hypothetical protein